MHYVRAVGRLARDSVFHVPIELLAGAVTTGMLLVILIIFVLLGVSEVTTQILVDLVQQWGNAVMLLVALTVCAVYRQYFMRMPALVYRAASLISFGSYMGLFVAFYSLVTTLVFSLANQLWTVQVSLWYLALDAWLGVYVGLDALLGVILAHPVLYEIISFCYRHTVNAMVVGLLILLVTSYRLTRQYLIAVFISMLLSLVLWVSLPAIAPYQLMVSDKLATSPLSGQIALQTVLVDELYDRYDDTGWASQVSAFAYYWEDVTTDHGYAVSSNPSMHVIWGVILVYFLWRSHWVLGIVALVFTVFETIGTMLFLQHYLIDLPVGVLFGLASVSVSAFLYQAERERMTVRPDFWFMPVLFTSEHCKRCITKLVGPKN